MGKIEGLGLERFIIGDRIKAGDRKTFTPSDTLDCLYNAPSGSIGFMDVGMGRREIPSIDRTKRADVLEICVIGVEPEYRRSGFGFGSMLVQHAIKIAKERGLKAVYVDTLVPGSGSIEMLVKNDFTHVLGPCPRGTLDYCYKWV